MSKINDETGHYNFCIYDPQRKGGLYCCRCHGKNIVPISCYNMLCGDCWYSFCAAQHWDRHLSSCANYRCDELKITMQDRTTINQYNFIERLGIVCYTRYIHVSSVRRSIAVEKHKMKRTKKAIAPKLKKLIKKHEPELPELPKITEIGPEINTVIEPEPQRDNGPKFVSKVQSVILGRLYDWTGVPIPEPEGWAPLPDPEIEELTTSTNPEVITEKLPDVSDVWVNCAFPM